MDFFAHLFINSGVFLFLMSTALSSGICAPTELTREEPLILPPFFQPAASFQRHDKWTVSCAGQLNHINILRPSSPSPFFAIATPDRVRPIEKEKEISSRSKPSNNEEDAVGYANRSQSGTTGAESLSEP